MYYNQKHNPINTTSINDIRLIDLEVPRRFGGHNTTSHDVEQVMSQCDLLEKMARKYPLKYPFTTHLELIRYGFEQMSKIYFEKHQEMLEDYDLYVRDFSLYLSSSSITPQDVWHELNGDFECYGHPFDFERFVNYATLTSMHDSDVPLDLQMPSRFSEKQKCKRSERVSALISKSCKSFLQKCENGFKSDPTTFAKITPSSETKDDTRKPLDRLNSSGIKEKIRRSGFNSLRSKTIGKKIFSQKNRRRRLMYDDDFVLLK